MYISEAATFDRVIADFQSHLVENPGVPLFSFVITIQNHGPYIDKYGADLPINFHSQVPFSDRDANAFSNYLYGMIDMDVQLGRLAETVRDSDEPVVIAYFGDHLPSFEHSIYDILLPNDGTNEDRIRRHRTPYLIWANEAAKPLVTEIEGGDMSALFFGAAILEFIGLGQAEPFFAKINAMRQNISIILEDAYYTSDGVLRQKADGVSAMVDNYLQWSYFRIFE
jgi:phosphoglycerol transferase MdoB-like AlkP superfamily enzyme